MKICLISKIWKLGSFFLHMVFINLTNFENCNIGLIDFIAMNYDNFYY